MGFKQKIGNAGRNAKALSRNVKQAGSVVNKLDNLLNGKLLATEIGRSLALGSEVVTGGLDYFGGLMESFGDLSLTHPGANRGMVAGVANGMTVRSTKPRLRNARGVVKIMHKELVATINNSATTNVFVNNNLLTTNGTSYLTVNAQNPVMFPWLSQIAANYDYYRVKRMRLVYVPLCATSTAGRVSIIYDPDSSDPAPQSKNEISAMECYTEGPVWGTSYLDIQLSDTNKWYYGESSLGTNTSGAYLDQGQVYWATTSGAAGTVGELYALYEVELKSPQAAPNVVAVAHVTGTTVVNDFQTNIGVQLDVANMSATQIALTFTAPGTYKIDYEIADATATGATSVANVFILDDAFVIQASPLPDRVSRTTIVTASTTGATLRIPGNTAMTAYDILVTRVSPRTPPGGWISI